MAGSRIFLKEQGADIKERGGSRIAISIGDHVLFHHRPHPSPSMDKGAVAALRDFLKRAELRRMETTNEHIEIQRLCGHDFL